MTDEELVGALSELDEIRETAERELEAVRARGEALKRLEHDRDALMESYAGCCGSAFASGQTGLWRSQAWYRKKRRWVRRIANFRHLAYKGFVDTRGAQETGNVR